MRKAIVVITIFLVNSILSFGQKDFEISNTREIVISFADSIIKADILTVSEEFKIKDDLKYYWFNNSQFGYNIGGINGKPLHGTFSVLNKQGLLLSQGEFKYGLKNGKWKSWYTSGELKRIENWKDGLLDGEMKYLSETGEVYLTKQFKKGTEISSDKSFLNKIFKKKESTPKDSTQNEVETTEKE